MQFQQIFVVTSHPWNVIQNSVSSMRFCHFTIRRFTYILSLNQWQYLNNNPHLIALFSTIGYTSAFQPGV